MNEMTAERLSKAQDLIAHSVGAFLPETVLSITICVLLIADLFGKSSWRRSLWIAGGGLGLATLVLLFLRPSSAEHLFGWETPSGEPRGMLLNDAFGWFFKLLVLGTSLLVLPMVRVHADLKDRPLSEFYALLLGASLGMFLMVGANNFLMIYLGIEFASMSSYLLTAYVKRDSRGSEAGLKYVVYGSVASGVMIFGISLLYGMTGSLHLADLSEVMTAGKVDATTCAVASVLIFAGFAYKMAAYPMHFWAPDVYQGATTPITAYLSVASKAAGFAVFVRFLSAFDPGFAVRFEGFGGVVDSVNFGWQHLIAIAAALSMTAGNMAALWQQNVKRLLAYSSVAHAGYLLMGVAALQSGYGDFAVQALLFYFIAYFAMNMGAFFIVNLMAAKTGSERISSYAGLGRRAPFLGACLFLFLLSLIGLPPTAGFTGKWLLLSAAIKSDMVWLAVVAGVNTAISAFYYLRLIKTMYFDGAESESSAPSGHYGSIAIVGAFAAVVLYLGLSFGPVSEWTKGLTL